MERSNKLLIEYQELQRLYGGFNVDIITGGLNAYKRLRENYSHDYIEKEIIKLIKIN